MPVNEGSHERVGGVECSGWLGLNSSSVRLTFFFGQRPARVAKFLNAALVLLTASLPRGCQLMHIAKPMKKMGAPGMMGITQPTRPRTMTGIPRRAMMVLRTWAILSTDDELMTFGAPINVPAPVEFKGLIEETETSKDWTFGIHHISGVAIR